VVSCFGNVPLIFFNVSILERPALSADELRALLDVAAQRAKKSSFPAALMLRDDWVPEGWQDVAASYGLAPTLPLTGMETEDLLAPRRAPAALEIRKVDGDTRAREVAELNAQAYGMPLELCECVANMNLWHEDSLGFVGYHEGKPVTCAGVFPVAGTVYVALVATAPEAQGKGFAETVMRHAVEEGQRAMGTKLTTLHASEMGARVYRAMGYSEGPKLWFLGPSEH
jgi:GNAT superfamily N-acetyltransferase